VNRITAGCTLRIQAPQSFQLHWTADEWQSTHDTIATPTTLGINFVDIPIAKGQRAPVRFTFLWTDTQHWEGRDYLVEMS
jgi:glucoamylase